MGNFSLPLSLGPETENADKFGAPLYLCFAFVGKISLCVSSCGNKFWTSKNCCWWNGGRRYSFLDSGAKDTHETKNINDCDRKGGRNQTNKMTERECVRVCVFACKCVAILSFLVTKARSGTGVTGQGGVASGGEGGSRKIRGNGRRKRILRLFVGSVEDSEDAVQRKKGEKIEMTCAIWIPRWWRRAAIDSWEDVLRPRCMYSARRMGDSRKWGERHKRRKYHEHQLIFASGTERETNLCKFQRAAQFGGGPKPAPDAGGRHFRTNRPGWSFSLKNF